MPYEIEGMTILDQTKVDAVMQPQGWCAMLVLTSAILSVIFVGLAIAYFSEKKSILFTCMAACFIILFAGCFTVPDKIVSPEYVKYSVTIDDSVSMNEFLEHYEILDQHGKIYEIREIVNDAK